MRVLIIGCGYVGIPLGERLAKGGQEVFGMRRSGSADEELKARGISPLHADITEPGSLAQIRPEFDWVVNVTSSSRGGVEEYRAVYLQGTRNILEWLKPNPPQRFVYTSSTSVYAQNDGSWVTEESEAEPQSETSQVLRETERALLDGFPGIVLRTSGIYGPERGHLFKQFLRGEAAMRDGGEAWLNMVQVEDVAGAIEHSLRHGAPGEIYNLTDDLPVTQREFFSWLAKKLGRPIPPSAPGNPDRKRGLTNKRLSNAKLKQGTGYQFRFPTYREGYAEEMRRLGLRVD
jgi:nucleoside-diphosphate-sugar epimerase